MRCGPKKRAGGRIWDAWNAEQNNQNEVEKGRFYSILGGLYKSAA